ncbi:MAG: phage tail tape measure protein [Dehalococcoidia bacterium]
MSTETEIDRLLVRLVGDATSYQKMLNDAQTGARRTADTVEREGKRIERFAASLRTFGQGVRGAGAAMSLAITTPLLAISGAASHASMSFEQALQRLRSLVSMSREDIDSFRETALKMAANLGQSPIDIVNTFESISSGGIKGAAALDALEASAKASSIGMGDMQTIGRAASLALATYGEESLKASEAIEMVWKAADRGLAEASGFASVFGKILPAAKAAKLEFGETAGTLSALTLAYGETATAATALSSMISKIRGAGVSPKIIKQMEASGYSMKELQKVFADQGIVEGIKYLDAMFAKTGITQLQFFSDKEAENAFNVLRDSKQFASIVDDVSQSVGGINSRYKEWEETMGAKMAKAMAGTQAMMIKLGDMLAPIVQKLTQWGLSAMEVWNMLTPEMQKVAVVVLAVVAAIGPLLVGFGTMAVMISSVISGFVALSSAITFLLPLAPMIMGIVVAIAALGVALYHMRGPIIEVFNDLKKYFSDTIAGMTAALRSGEIELAWEIVMTQIKLTFLQVITDMTMHLLGFMKLFTLVNPGLALIVRDLASKTTVKLGIETFTTQLKLNSLTDEALRKGAEAAAEAAADAAGGSVGGTGPAATAFKEGKYYASEGVQATTVGSAEAMARVSAYRSLSEGSAAERTAKGVEEVVGILEQIRDMGGGLSPAALAESA